MPHQSNSFDQLRNALWALLRWLPAALLVGIVSGGASAVLIRSLQFAADVRESHRWVIALLPLAGLATGLLYSGVGRSVDAGNNLVFEEIHNPQKTLPLRMTPLILLSTFLTHLFGGSAGREGTAVQAGASLADQFVRPLRLREGSRTTVLCMGLSAGFASVFGAPLAGTVFGIEVLAIGSVQYSALAPCLLSAVVADLTTRMLGAHHESYIITGVPALNPLRLICTVAAGIVFGLAAMLFSRSVHRVSGMFQRSIRWAPLRPFVGGAVVALLIFASGTTKYAGLGLPGIVEAFAHRQPFSDSALKLVLTAITLGAGFKGGEVTPLFFIGSSLGSALSAVLPIPTAVLAAMGFASLFCGAANVPIASVLMAFELFGAEAGVYAGVACVIAYLFSGHRGIYSSQRLRVRKHDDRATGQLTEEPTRGLHLPLI